MKETKGREQSTCAGLALRAVLGPVSPSPGPEGGAGGGSSRNRVVAPSLPPFLSPFLFLSPPPSLPPLFSLHTFLFLSSKKDSCIPGH